MVGGDRSGRRAARRSAVRELTGRLDLSAWPTGTRVIVRREPLHPGAQTSLFPNLEFRYWGHYTDQAGGPVTLDAYMRAHAHVEDHIGGLIDSGLLWFPFVDHDANRAWLAVVCFAADLIRWFKLLCLGGALASDNPKRLRWTLWHPPARLVYRARRRVVRILDGWPTAGALLGAYQRLALIN